MRKASRPVPLAIRHRLKRTGAFLGIATLAAFMVSGVPVDPLPAHGQQPAQSQEPGQGQQLAPQATKGPVGWDTYRNPHAMSQLRGAEQSHQFSSYARDGSNDDGFEGTYSCLRTTDQGCVIAEKSGAGEIAGMWFTRQPYGDPTGTGNITIELDGRVVLDEPLVDVVEGRVGAPFEWPLVGGPDDSSGGAVIKVPMPYRESMRVTVDHNPEFYHVNYRTFPDAEGVSTFDPSDKALDVLERLRDFGVADPKPANPEATTTSKDFELPPGASVPIAELSGPAQINELRMQIPQLVASPQVVDDGRAFGPGGGSSFQADVAPNNEGVRVVRRFDPQVADQVADMFVDGERAGQWSSGAASPGDWGVQAIDVAPELTRDKSSIEISNRFVSAPVDVNEFRYDVQSLVNGKWVRTDVLDLGPAHPGEEKAHGYQIDNPVFERTKLLARHATSPEEVTATDEVLENAKLRITFDGKTTVDSPIGEFFGSGLGEHDVRTMMSSIDTGENGWYTAWWPMPFSQNATVELVNDSDVAISSGTAEVTSAPAEFGDNTAYFHATHKRAQTQAGQDWNFVDVEGAGTFYGVTHSMRGLIPPYAGKRHEGPLSRTGVQANQRNYLEGDERFYVNGSSSPAWYGTGTEDYYEGGWYFRDGTTFSMPLAGNPSHEMAADGCLYDCTGAYRLQVPDAVSFSDGLRAGVEHGPGNDEPGDYSSTAYWYGGVAPTHEQTDEVDLGDQTSRDSHGYTAEGEAIGPLESTFEGMRNPEPFTDDSSITTGRIEFEMAVSADNDGARLRRLGDQHEAHQAVDVRVDGQPAGRWSQPLGNRSHRWLEDTFELPAELTAGKDRVRIELVPVDGAPPWAAAKYTLFSH